MLPATSNLSDAPVWPIAILPSVSIVNLLDAAVLSLIINLSALLPSALKCHCISVLFKKLKAIVC